MLAVKSSGRLPSPDTTERVKPDLDSPPIERFAKYFDMPLDLAVCFVGRSESETAHRIALFREYMAGVAEAVREDGYPLNPMGGTLG